MQGLPLAKVEGLGERERRAFEPDLGHLRPAQLRCLVLVEGAPMGLASLVGTVSHAGSSHGALSPGRALAADERGQGFQFMALPGRYDLSLMVRDGDHHAQLFADEPIVLVPGQVAEGAVFHVRAARVRFRVTGSDGEPRSGVQLLVRRAGKDPFLTLRQATGRGGETTGLVPAGSVELFVVGRRPARSSEPVARIALGAFEFAVGERKEPVEVVLPATAGH
jgi:hypothetical protein